MQTDRQQRGSFQQTGKERREGNFAGAVRQRIFARVGAQTILEVADVAVVMIQGRIMMSGSPDEVRDGLSRLRAFFAAMDAEEQMEQDGMVRHLRKIEDFVRREHQIEATLQEQLAQAIANEEYEAAARLRDELRKRTE